MALLILFGFIAGAATAVSPCVLPVLPVALSAGATGGRRRPAGIVAGLVFSFTFATVALVYVIDALGLPDDLIRNLAIVVLIGFGLVLLLPSLSSRLESWVSQFTARFTPKSAGDGFWSGTVVGASLGLVYAPCAGPILASVITVSASQTFTAGRLAVALAYALGSGLVLYLLMLGGRKLINPLVKRVAWFQAAMGVVLMALPPSRSTTRVGLGAGLDAVGRDGETDLADERDDRADDRSVVRVGGDRVDGDAVDAHLVER